LRLLPIKLITIKKYKKEAVIKLFQEIAPGYINRPGGYTRVIPLGKRTSDTATLARLEWVS